MAKKKIFEDHPIDKLFREGMEQRQFVYEQTFWEDAEKTLADFNRTASRKRRGWWLGGVSTLLIVLSIFLWQRFSSPCTLSSGRTAMPASQLQETDPAAHDHAISTTATSDQSVATQSADAIRNAYKPVTNANNIISNKQEHIGTTSSNMHAAKLTESANMRDHSDNDNTEQVSTNISAENPNRDPEPVSAIAMDVDEVKQLPTDTVITDPAIAISSALTRGALPPRDPGTPRMQWYAGMYAGTQRSYPAFTGGPGMWSSYIEDKERQAFSPVISLEAGMKIKRIPIDLNLGATFMQMGEDGLFAITNTVHDTTIVIETDSLLIMDSTYVDTGWVYSYDWLVMEDSIIMISSNDTTIIRKASNRLYYVEIPVLFGYIWQYKQWNFRLSTGPSLAILHKRAGYYPNDDFTAFDALEDVDYFNKTVWYWRAEPAIGYAISPNVLLQCRGSFRIQLSDTYTAGDRSLRYWTHGVQMGLRYTFMGK